jgi:hypothetical protein
MKLLAIIIMLIALYLLYRIAFFQPAATKNGDDIPGKKAKSTRNVMGKSLFVLPDRSKPLPTSATISETEKSADKKPTFASETDVPSPMVIPAAALDEVFGEDVKPEELDIPPDDEEGDMDFEAEGAAEELNRVLRAEALFAGGMDYDDLQSVVKVVNEQPGTVSEETGSALAALEHTDMFEMLVSGEGCKMNWIKSVIERHVQSRMPETENDISGTDYGDFEIADFLG